MTASVQTHMTIARNQTYGDANVQTDAVDKLDRDAQTDVTTGPSRDVHYLRNWNSERKSGSLTELLTQNQATLPDIETIMSIFCMVS